MAKALTNEEWTFARRCYISGIASPSMARSLQISLAEADSLFDRFRKQGFYRKRQQAPMPVTLPRLRYLEGTA